ncbi:hypothetical protein CS8_005700 [Cupriavidus sp. 8B]
MPSTPPRGISEAINAPFYRECAQVVGRVNDLTDQMRELRATPTGRPRIQMLPGFALGHFGASLAEFNRRYPAIQLDVIVNDRVVDPIEEGFDVAFQIIAPISESLIERRLFPVRRLFCAAPSYLDNHGTPQHGTQRWSGTRSAVARSRATSVVMAADVSRR